MALAASVVPAAAASASTSTAAPAAGVTHQVAAVHEVGTFNLGKLAAAAARRARTTPVKKTRQQPLGKLPAAARAGAATAAAAAVNGSGRRTITGANVRGERGFTGITAPVNAAVNPSIGDVSPPDQGLAVGPLGRGKAVVEFVNMSLDIFAPNGANIAGAIPAAAVVQQPADSFLSDPRAYWDPKTGHWFFTMFDFGDGVSAPLSQQFIAVSDSKNLLGAYTVFAIDTSDSSNTANGCPCFGDFDQIGADANGFYIATNEFSVDNFNFNGAVIYAVSKSQLVAAAEGQPVTPFGARYQMLPQSPLTQTDPFGSYHISPASVPQGAASPGTEYFVESNGNLPYDNKTYGTGLEVFALLHTAQLNNGVAPTMVEATVKTESYSQPPNAVQKKGFIYRGPSEGVLQTDFNAIQEVTYARGLVYAELNTGFKYRGTRSGAAWFILKPTARSSSIKVKLVRNGYVKTTQDLLYPVIGVNAKGNGYMAFAVSGKSYYPSAAYVAFKGTRGPVGPVRLAARGNGPLDDFTCYIPGLGGCRYGDYSAAQLYNGRMYMATEYVSTAPGDLYTNWGTRVWSAATP